MDSHANTFIAGQNCFAMKFAERVCDVMPYTEDYAPKTGIPVVQAASGCTNASGHQRYILIFNEALYMPELENSLMNPNQLRHFGVEVQDNPYHPKPMVIATEDDTEGFIACLKSQGTNKFIDTWTPTQHNLELYPRVVLTSSKPWNPDELKFPGPSAVEIAEVDGRNISSIQALEFNSRRELEMLCYGDGYNRPMKVFDVFDIQTFNYRIMKSTVVPTIISKGPLAEDQILPPKTFISSKRHSRGFE